MESPFESLIGRAHVLLRKGGVPSSGAGQRAVLKARTILMKEIVFTRVNNISTKKKLIETYNWRKCNVNYAKIPV
jgi:hypothetical protein